MILPTLGLLLIGSPEFSQERVEAILRLLPIERKIDLLGGNGIYDAPGDETAGIPSLRFSDGPVGVRNFGKTTAYPAGACLAATWDTALARRFGDSVARDSRARGVHVWLGPGVNLARVPQNGRNFEYLGEDPILSGTMAASIIGGVQAGGVSACVKHFVANEHESDRNNDSSDLDERTLRELYLLPFQMAVEAGVGTVMTSYNLVNGVHMSENQRLINGVLKGEWGFPGLVMSDWGSTYTPEGVVRAGLDLEMPSGVMMSRAKLLPLLRSGAITEAQIDDKLRRRMRLIQRFGFDTRRGPDDSIPKDDPKSAATALQIAREGVVLLKNANGTLPLDRSKLRRILVVGPNAKPPATGGGGSSYTEGFDVVDLVSALRKISGGVRIEYVPFDITPRSPVPFEYGGSPGWAAEYFPTRDFKGTPLRRRDIKIDFDWKDASPETSIPIDDFSVRWTAELTPRKTERYLISATSDDGVRVFVDERKVLEYWGERGVATDTTAIRLQGGKRVKLRVEYFERGGQAVCQFSMTPISEMLAGALPEQKAREADAIVVAAGFNASMESEGFDRSFDLPLQQEMLINRAVALNPRTVVCMNSGAGVNMSAWVKEAGAIVQAWYPGQNGNQALAEILFGDTNPSGKLTTTFPLRLAGTYYSDAYPSKGRRMPYREGLLMGYRWFDAKSKQPLFPFGFGLSYTRFALSDLRLRRGEKAITAEISVRNTGRKAGAEVAQLYVDSVPEAGRPPRELKGFARVELAPGEQRRVRIEVPYASLRTWDTSRSAWSARTGAVRIRVGTSSRDLPLRGSLLLPLAPGQTP